MDCIRFYDVRKVLHLSGKVFQGYIAWRRHGEWVELKELFKNSEISMCLLNYHFFLYCLVKLQDFTVIRAKTNTGT